jgi:hypothetical protein
MRQPVAAAAVVAAALAALPLPAAGCRAEATEDQLARRASFDFGCAVSELRFSRIDERTTGVVGCGKHATYVESCDGLRTNTSTRCTWLLNGKIEVDRRPPPEMDPDPGDVAAPTP